MAFLAIVNVLTVCYGLSMVIFNFVIPSAISNFILNTVIPNKVILKVFAIAILKIFILIFIVTPKVVPKVIDLAIKLVFPINLFNLWFMLESNSLTLSLINLE